MTDESRIKNLVSVRRYQASIKGKATISAYQRKPEVRKQIAKRFNKYSRTPHGKFKEYKDNAARRGIEFSLSFEQFIVFWQKPCRYCNTEVPTIGLDRVDNAKGYILGNVVPCCRVCNKAKKAMDPVSYVAHCAAATQHFKMCQPSP